MLKFEILLCCLFYYKKSEVSAGRIYLKLFIVSVLEDLFCISFPGHSSDMFLITNNCSNFIISSKIKCEFYQRLYTSLSDIGSFSPKSFPVSVSGLDYQSPSVHLSRWSGLDNSPLGIWFLSKTVIQYKKPPLHNLTPLSTQYVGQISHIVNLRSVLLYNIL